MSVPRSVFTALDAKRSPDGEAVLRKHIGMVLGEATELPNGTTAFGFHPVGFPRRPWRWVAITTGQIATEWIGGHTPTSRHTPAVSRLDPDWQQHQDDIGTEGNERELRNECEQ